jgi:hypothetical protein
VRDHIDPSKDLGHSDRHGKKKEATIETNVEATDKEGAEQTGTAEVKRNADGTICKDCT